MRFIDDMIVKAAKAILGGVMAVGTGLVYIQFIFLRIVLAIAGTTPLAVAVAAVKAAIFGG